MKNVSLSSLVVLLATAGLGAACTVSFPEDGQSGAFPCESDEDCVEEGQDCLTNENGVNVCRVPPQGGEECVDEDGDGYGAQEPTNNCPACQQNQPNGCEVDCDDTNAEINPGETENCDGRDNDCDGETDEAAGVEACANDGSCPLDVSPPQDGTVFGCGSVDGTSQCVLTGNFSNADACPDDSLGVCEDGSWTEVPCECTTNDPENDCPN